MNTVILSDLADFLASLDAGSVDALITSPPFVGLPGRADTMHLSTQILNAADRILKPAGTITLIVGAAPGNPLLPYHVASDVSLFPALTLHSQYVWDRTGTLERAVGQQNITHDTLLHITRSNIVDAPPIAPTSVIRTSIPGFNYGIGVTTPPDLAAYLVDTLSRVGDLIVDPLAGLGEIGVQARAQGRRFKGCDTNPACVEIANARLAEHNPVLAAV